MTLDLHPKLVADTRDKSIHTFGYQYIFDKRAEKYGRYVNWLKVLGILVPAVIGTTVITYDYKIVKDISIAVLSVVTILQFALSILSIIYKWDDELSYAYESSQAHNSLYLRFKKLCEYPPSDFNELNHLYDLLVTESNSRAQQDTKHGISEAELR